MDIIRNIFSVTDDVIDCLFDDNAFYSMIQNKTLSQAKNLYRVIYGRKKDRGYKKAEYQKQQELLKQKKEMYKTISNLLQNKLYF